VKRIILTAVLVMGAVLFNCGLSRADEPVNNETLLKEIRELKNIVTQQAKKINDLESRVAQQETKAAIVGAPVNISEIDKKIDERLSQKAPAYQLMEGLSLSVGMTSVLQGAHNVNGNDQLSNKEDSTAGTISADITLNKKFGDYGEGFVYITAGQGAGLDGKIKTFGNVNYDADSDQTVRLSEAWYEVYFQQISGALAFGKLDPTKYVDTNSYANDETTQFLGGIFRNSPAVEFTDNSLGVHFGVSPLEFFDLNLVAVDTKTEGDSAGEDIFDAMFVGGQVNFKPKFFGKDGNYRFYAWENGANHTKWADAAKDKENSHGYGISFDQELTDVIGVFARYGWQDPKVFTPQYDSAGALDWSGSVYSIEQSWSVGPQFKGTAWGRPDDVTAIAFGQIIPSNDYKKYYGTISGTGVELQAKTENRLEWYYNYKVNEHLSLSPDLQVIWQPYGKDSANGDGTIVIGGLRGQMDF